MTEEFNGYSTENPGGIGDELLPCPFCGGKGLHQLHPGNPMTTGFFHSIECQSCFSGTFHYNDTKEKAIENWNTRVKSPSNGLIPLDENKVFEIVRANNNTFVSDTDCMYISKTLCSKFGVKAPSISVEEIENVMKEVRLLGNLIIKLVH